MNVNNLPECILSLVAKEYINNCIKENTKSIIKIHNFIPESNTIYSVKIQVRTFSGLVAQFDTDINTISLILNSFNAGKSFRAGRDIKYFHYSYKPGQIVLKTENAYYQIKNTNLFISHMKKFINNKNNFDIEYYDI